ncbi:helix-turn-helix transcriptional regulator [Nonomuraea jiangxiensis]|uniref:Predicted transcriptional regulator, ArsR family n=1 Tax=Nonomuraea jiangxiensis TaxID=633440 RepID=A0A1G8A462_9ACTN|nr:transcriptional regulator [Nonomuraea jiangxiensis]SDH15647.1 Predicted transcriptional regulator, ArsR family [Nonomuraea jiangxiensis]
MASDVDPAAARPPATAGVETIAVLGDEVRRGMYGFVRRARRPVTREEVAGDAGISAKLAAFHLDKLVAAGLLRARYDNPAGVRRVGRKPKVYEPAGRDVRISIPERHPDLLAEILIDAMVTTEPGEDPRSAARRVAHGRGEELGAELRARTRPGRLGPERSLTLSRTMLEQHGFEPQRQAATELRLLNCPFHPLAARSPELVCGISHAFLDGFLTGLQAAGIEAVPSPRPGYCCVELRTTRGGTSSGEEDVTCRGAGRDRS